MSVEVMGKYLWMAVDADEYELPICVADSAQELADKFGVTDNTIRNCVMRGRSGRENGYKYLKVERRED